MSPATPKRFKVAFSFAGEKRDFVAQVADILAAQFGKDCILYDKYHEAEFAQFDLGIRLPMLYGEQSELIVPVLCPDYDQKRWTGWEWMHIYSLLTNKDGQRVMLSRFELATVAGLSEAAGFIELDHKTPRQFADLILQRLAQLSSTANSFSGQTPRTTVNSPLSTPTMHLCGDVNTQAMVVADGISSLGGISNTEIGKVCENQPKACLKHCDQKMTIGNMKKAKLKSAQEGEGYILNNAAPEIHIGEIIGGGNIVGNQGEIYMQIHMSPPPKPNLLIQPSDEHISAEQRLALKKLVYEWVALHNSIKKTPLSYGSAWARTNEAARATSYSLILKAHLCKAIAFVQQEMAKLRSMRSAPTKDDKWRQKRIAAIKARSKSQLRNADAYKPYIKKAFNADSLSALSTDELQKTYAYIMKKKAPEL